MFKEHKTEKIAILSVLVNCGLAVGKIFIGLLSGYASVLAEGFHSAMDIISSLIGLIGIKVSKKPVDKEHPYGHYKFEVFSGLIITVILFFTGTWIIYDAFQRFLHPVVLEFSFFALLVMGISAAVNECMARLKIYYGKKEKSITLISDGMHSRVDVYTSLIIFMGLFLVRYWIYTDAALALFLGIYIIKKSFSLGKEAADSLLDVSAGEEVENKIKEIAKKHNIKISDLKTQKRGSAVTANIEILLPKNLSVEEASKISDELREDLTNQIESLKYIAIQIKSHDVSESYFQPRGVLPRMMVGRGFRWERRGKFRETIQEARAFGPGGYCICQVCGYKIPHKRGVPCATLRCPKCGNRMIRMLDKS